MTGKSGTAARFENPYPFYKEQREQSPVYQDDQGTWFLTRYDDVKLLLSDLRFSRRPPESFGFLNQERVNTALDEVIGRWAVLNDPPEHTRLRNALNTIINPRFIKETRGMIESIADELLLSLLESSPVDFMDTFAYPLPVKVINKLLGSDLDIPTTRKWAVSLATALDHGSPEDFQAITTDVLAMREYFTDIIHLRERENQNDWISDLVNLKKSGQLSMDDVVSTCIFLMLAGHETVQLTTGLGLMTLIKHPSQLQLLQQNPELVSSAIEEILRHESSLNKISRWTREKIVLGNVTIPENQLVVGLLNAANRDPEKYPDPDRFDITRENNRHLTFGLGIHNCVGALLARIELQVAFTRLLPHLHKFSLLEDQIEWLPNSSFRYLFKLKVAFNP
jgi:cytochrome P450